MNLLEKLKQLPNDAGVYQYFDKDGHLLYIGKAKKLVTQSDGTTMTLTVKMAAQFKDLSYVSVVKKVNGNEE